MLPKHTCHGNLFPPLRDTRYTATQPSRSTVPCPPSARATPGAEYREHVDVDGALSTDDATAMSSSGLIGAGIVAG
jgi:hypothetical protein